MVLTEDTFHFDPPLRADVERGVRAHPWAEAGTEPAQVIFVRPGNAKHKNGANTVMGRAAIYEDRLVVSASSIERADRLRAELEAGCAGVLRFQSRSTAEPEFPKVGAPTGPREAPPPEVQALLKQKMEAHWSSWPDIPLPALEGKTPREVTRTRAGREQLELLLKEIAFSDARAEPWMRYGVERLRKELGLL